MPALVEPKTLRPVTLALDDAISFDEEALNKTPNANFHAASSYHAHHAYHTHHEHNHEHGAAKGLVSATKFDLRTSHSSELASTVVGPQMWVTAEAGHSNLMQYDFDALQAWATLPYVFARCSVFRLKKSLGLQILMQLCIVLATFLSLKAVQKTTGEEAFEDTGQWEDDGSDSRRSANLDAADLKPLEDLTTYLNRLVPFLLGLFISLVMRRWWSLRSSHLQRIYSSGAQLSFWLRMCLPSSAQWIRRRIEQYFLLGEKLVYLCAKQMDDKSMLQQVKEGGVLEDVEYEQLAQHLEKVPPGMRLRGGTYDFDLAALPFNWAAHLIYRMYLFDSRTKGKYGLSMPPPVLVKMLSYCMDARNGVEDIEMTLSNPLPFPYVHLVCMLVHLSVLFQCLKSGFSLGIEVVLTPQRIAYELIFIVAMNTLYCGLLCLAAVMWNPFGDDATDFPAAALHKRLRKAQHFSTALLVNNAKIDDDLIARFGQHDSSKRAKREKDEEDEEDLDEGEDGNDGQDGHDGDGGDD